MKLLMMMMIYIYIYIYHSFVFPSLFVFLIVAMGIQHSNKLKVEGEQICNSFKINILLKKREKNTFPNFKNQTPKAQRQSYPISGHGKDKAFTWT